MVSGDRLRGRRVGKRHALLLEVVAACVAGRSTAMHCASEDDADRWRSELLALLPADVVGDLVTYTWPGKNPEPVGRSAPDMRPFGFGFGFD